MKHWTILMNTALPQYFNLDSSFPLALTHAVLDAMSHMDSGWLFNRKHCFVIIIDFAQWGKYDILAYDLSG